MKTETYERPSLVITVFDEEDVIVTSSPGGPSTGEYVGDFP